MNAYQQKWTTSGPNAQFGSSVFRSGVGNVAPTPGTASIYADFPADEAGPVIVSSVPADNATGVATTANIVITFDEDIAFGVSGTITLRSNSGGWADAEVFDVATDQGTGAGQVSIGGTGNKVLTINPTADFASATEYAVRFSAGAIKDGRGNAMAAIADDTTLSFTTVSAGVVYLDETGNTGLGNATITVDLTPLSLQSGDLVVVFIGTAHISVRTCAMSSAGYTAIGTKVDGNGSANDSSSHIFFKSMGGSPDTSVVVASSGSSGVAHVVRVRAYRSVNGTPIDVTEVASIGANTVAANPNAITPVTDNALIVAFGVGARASGPTDTYASADLANFTTDQYTNGSYNAVWGIGHKVWRTGDGAFNAAAWTGATGTTGDSWGAKAFALRPA